MTERDGLQLMGRRADGRYTYRVRPYVGSPPRRVARTFDMPTDSIKAARRKANDVVDALERNAKLTDVDRPTVARLLDDWIARKSGLRTQKAPSTRR